MIHTPAVLVGLCSHGLAIARSLGRKGIPVFALESNPKLSGTRTRYAHVLPATNINGPELITDLIACRDRFREAPVLYVTNDNMVRTVAGALDQIRSRYRLHWPEADVVRSLLDKGQIESIARSSGLGYPRSHLVSGLADLGPIRGELTYPIAFKPTKPLSGFKAMRLDSERDLSLQLQRYEGTVDHFLLQEWVSGMEPNIYFANFYFDGEHRPVASFVGRKVRSYPRNVGGACSAEGADRADIKGEALRFFQNVPVRGPASLEIKEDETGRRFVIEPTIGRFDYYIQCCVVNGVDFPFLAYTYQMAQAMPRPPVQVRGRGRMWVDFEKDFPSLVGSLGEPGGWRDAIRFLLRRKAFALWAWDDPGPSVLEWPRSFWRYMERAAHRLVRILPGRSEER